MMNRERMKIARRMTEDGIESWMRWDGDDRLVAMASKKLKSGEKVSCSHAVPYFRFAPPHMPWFTSTTPEEFARNRAINALRGRLGAKETTPAKHNHNGGW